MAAEPAQATTAPSPDPQVAWLNLSPFEQAKAWEKSAPETAAVVRQLAVRYANHQLAFQWADRLLGVCSLAALTAVGWHYADVGAPTSGLWVFGSGAAASAAGMVGARWVSSRNRTRKPPAL